MGSITINFSDIMCKKYTDTIFLELQAYTPLQRLLFDSMIRLLHTLLVLISVA